MIRRPVPSTGGRIWCGEDGSVWSTARGGLRRLSPYLKGSRTERARKRGGYLIVGWSDHGHRVKVPVHRLVAEAFCGGFHPLLDVHHVNGDCRDNRAANLACMTRLEHERAHGKAVMDCDIAECRLLFEREREAYDRRMSVAGAKAPCNASAIAGIMRRADAIAWDARSIIGTSEAKGA